MTLRFPIPLTAFEEYFVLHDHRDAPSTIWFRFDLDQELDRELAEQMLPGQWRSIAAATKILNRFMDQVKQTVATNSEQAALF